MTATDLAARFFLAAAVILVVCRGAHWLAARVGQPPVVAEMIAGVLLGPSLLGAVWPWGEAHVFPPVLRPLIYVAGQLGLVALMFGAGRELRARVRQRLAGTAMTVSALGVAVPFLLGAGLTLVVHGHVPVFATGVSVGITAAFVGTTLAITAFPMLARIIVERRLSSTRHGSLSLAAGALDDVLAWLLLAGVLSAAAGHAWPVLKAVGGSVIFAVVLLGVVRPVLRLVVTRPGVAPHTVVVVTLVVLFAAAWYTDEIGLYAVFGAFSVGLAAPEHDAMTALEPVTTSMTQVFVPLFFVYSGLNTRFGLFTDGRVAMFAIAAVVVAVLGKFSACWFGARLRGEDPVTAARIGTLMNARGLMQLIALNVGLQAGIVTPTLFTTLVLVAVVTTVMTAPVLTLLDRRDDRQALARSLLASASS